MLPRSEKEHGEHGIVTRHVANSGPSAFEVRGRTLSAKNHGSRYVQVQRGESICPEVRIAFPLKLRMPDATSAFVAPCEATCRRAFERR